MADDENFGTEVVDIGAQGDDWLGKGFCRVCGAELADKRREYCDEHRAIAAAKSHKKKAPPRSSSAPSSRPARPERTVAQRMSTGGTAPVSDAKAAATIAKLLVVITLMLMWARVRRIGLPDPSGELVETLALTDEEAVEIARPLARFGNSTPTGARIIGPIARNEDIIGALFAMYEYNRRVDQILSEYTRGAVPANHPERTTPSRVTTEPVPSDRRDDSGDPAVPDPWGSAADLFVAQAG